MKNKYEVRGEITAIFVKYQGNEMETLVSSKDLPKIVSFPNIWFAEYNKRRNVYVVRGNLPVVKGKRERVLLHRWITNPSSNMVVDHINHNTLDNRSENLRVVTNSANGLNRKNSSKNNSSGQVGVYKKKGRNNGWEAYVTFNRKRLYLGYFDNFEEAQRVAVEARQKYIAEECDRVWNTQ